ncbi:MAG: hypothetical protein B7Y44_11375 [Sphingomonadales bacterium 28-55-16]|nr:MAG: hypothetical protein B7Y44_11375 [Sphingomonadales bacterium 28-55-16]
MVLQRDCASEPDSRTQRRRYVRLQRALWDDNGSGFGHGDGSTRPSSATKWRESSKQKNASNRPCDWCIFAWSFKAWRNAQWCRTALAAAEKELEERRQKLAELEREEAERELNRLIKKVGQDTAIALLELAVKVKPKVAISALEKLGG